MAFSNRVFSLALSILISSLFVKIAISADPLFHICSNSEKFTTKYSPYEKSLEKLFGYLKLKTPPTGFGLAWSGQYKDRSYGLSLCRGDVSMKDCGLCVSEATKEITERCPKNKGAIIWYDNCYLKYSDDKFFGEIDKQNMFYSWSLKNVTSNVEELISQKAKDLLSKLAENASGTSKMYAKGEVEIGEDEKKYMYGMAQCSRDLEKYECKKCLDDAVSRLPKCCEGKVGGRVVGGSCNIRYEIYPFLDL